MSYLSRRARRMRVVLLATILGAVFVVMTTSPADAHAIVERTEPGIDEVLADSPESVTMYFSEPVELSFGAIHVFDTNAERVDVGEADHLPGRPDAVTVGLQPDLPDGTYTVDWHVVSADSHPIGEAFIFHVGHKGPQSQRVRDELQDDNGPSPAKVLLGLSRWLDLAGLLLLGGGLAFLLIVWRSAAGSGSLPEIVASGFNQRWRRLMTFGWWSVVVGTALSLPLQAAVAGELSMGEAMGPTPIREVLSTRFGKVALVRLGLLLAVAVVHAIAARRREGGSQWSRGETWVSAAFVVVLLATPGLAGHPGTTSPVAVNVVVDLIHMLGAAAWVGGLVFLLKAAYPASDTGQRERVSLLGPVVARFSDLAVLGVSAVVLSGTFAAYMQLRSWSALTGSAYGQVLLAKIAVFLPLVALGGFNKNVVKPRIDRAVASGDDAGGLATLRRIVSYEVTLAIVVVALTAWLVSLAPGREAAAASEGPYQTTVTLGEGRLDVLVVPNRVGENEVHLTAVDDAGAPQKLDEMSALFRMSSEDIGPIVARGRKLAPGHYVIQGHQLSVPGDWTIEVVARTSRFEEERTTFPLTVRR